MSDKSEYEELTMQLDQDLEVIRRKALGQPQGILDGEAAAEERARIHQYKEDLRKLRKKYSK